MFWLDSLFLALTAVAALVGAWTGFLWQAARLLSLATALGATLLFHAPTVWAVRTHVAQGASELAVQVIAYLGVFLAVYLALFFLTRLLSKSLQASALQVLDRWSGAILGAAKMVVLLAGFSWAARFCGHPQAQAILQHSLLAPALAQAMENAATAIPDDYKVNLEQTWAQLGAWIERPHPPDTGRPEVGLQ